MKSSIATSDFMYRRLVQGVRDYAIYLLDRDGNVLNWNAGAERAKGYAPSEIVGRNYRCFYTEEDQLAGVPARNLEIALSNGSLTTEGWRVRKDGRRFWAHVQIECVYDDEGGFIGFSKITNDRTERLGIERQLIHRATHDQLTGLKNRTAFSEELEERLRSADAVGLAVHFIDLDRFKPVNDCLGHKAGDMVLCEVADRLRRVLENAGSVARFGGDEFAILQVDIDNGTSAELLAARLIEAIEQPVTVDGNVVLISASVGVACSPYHGESSDELLTCADRALYRSKNAGRGRFSLFAPEMNETDLSKSTLEINLRHACRMKAFQLHYQPIFSSRTMTVVGQEALLRWTDRNGRPVSPAEFIPLAESLGLMTEIGTWVLREACRTAATWDGNSYVAVNVSAKQLTNPAFTTIVLEALKETGLPPYRLELELTETAIIEKTEDVASTLEFLKNIGVSIALDDFGTGYSSLSLLGQLPLNRIKIDRGFTQKLDMATTSRAVARAIVSLSEALDLSVTAEGVETREQMHILNELGCHEMQGFLLGRPGPEAVFSFHLNEERKTA